MIVKIYEPPKDAPETEPVVRLMLQSAGDGIDLVAVNASGERLDYGYLCRIDVDGIHRYPDVDKALGFTLNDGARIHVNNI